MRGLFLLKIAQNNGQGSLTIMACALIKSFLKAHKSNFAIVPIRKEFSDSQWLLNYWRGDDVELVERVQLIPFDLSEFGSRQCSERQVGFLIGHNLMKVLTPRFGLLYDFILSNAFPSNVIAQHFMTSFYGPSLRYNIPMIGWSLWTATSKWGKWLTSENDWQAEVFGATLCDFLFYESQRVKIANERDMRSMFKPSQIARILQRSDVANNGISFDKIGEVNICETRKPVLIWSGRTEEDGEVLDFIFEVVKANMVSHVYLNFVTGEPNETQSKQIESCDIVTLQPAVKHTEYLEFLKRGDIFVSFCHGEARTYGIRFGEMMACGMLPVVHTEVAQTFLGGLDYQYHAETLSGLKNSLLRALSDFKNDPSTIYEQRLKILAYIGREHNTAENMKKMIDKTEELVHEFRSNLKMSPSFQDLFTGLEGVTRITQEELYALLSEQSDSKADFSKHFMITPNMIRQYTLSLGFVEVEPLVYERPACI